MTKLIAVHLLHLAGANGTVDVIEPGQSFIATDADNVERLIRLEAVRGVTEADKHATHIERSGKVVATQGKANLDKGDGDKAEDLSKLTKAKLLAIAKDESVTVDESATNADIVKAIEAARAAESDDLAS